LNIDSRGGPGYIGSRWYIFVPPSGTLLLRRLHKNARAKIYEEKRSFGTSDNLPPSRLLAHRLANYSFSPNAKYLLFTVPNNDKLAVKLLNLETGKTKIFHVNPHEISWKLDGSQVLINDRGDKKKICLISSCCGKH